MWVIIKLKLLETNKLRKAIMLKNLLFFLFLWVVLGPVLICKMLFMGVVVWHQEFKIAVEQGLYCGGTILTKNFKCAFIDKHSTRPCKACIHAHEYLTNDDRKIYEAIYIPDLMDLVMGTKNSCAVWSKVNL
jgi:hypothetical protein